MNYGRLTLVIDERHGVDVQTRYACSSLDNLEEAITDLQRREGATFRDRIGFADMTRGAVCNRARAKQPIACQRIRDWGRHMGFDAVIWTALGPRFKDKVGLPFSVDAAMRYIANLQEPARTLALDYIRKAPADIVTPVRRKATELFASLRMA